MGVLAITVSSGVMSGCHPHVALSAPPRDAVYEERASSYEELRPLSLHETHITYLRNSVPVGSARKTDYVQLASGKRVYYPEDLLPVLPQASPASEAARRSESARSTGTTMQVGGILLIVGGTGLMISPVLDDSSDGINTTPLVLGGVVILAGAVLGLVGSSSHQTANDEAATAFELYDRGLRERLDICLQGNQLVDCRRVSPGGVAIPAAAAPAAAPPTTAQPPIVPPPAPQVPADPPSPAPAGAEP